MALDCGQDEPGNVLGQYPAMLNMSRETTAAAFMPTAACAGLKLQAMVVLDDSGGSSTTAGHSPYFLERGPLRLTGD